MKISKTMPDYSTSAVVCPYCLKNITSLRFEKRVKHRLKCKKMKRAID